MKTCSPKLKVTNWYCKLVGLSKSVELLRNPRVAGPPSQAFPAPTWSWIKPLKNHGWKTTVGKVTFQGLCLYYVKLWGVIYWLKPAEVGWFSGCPRPTKNNDKGMADQSTPYGSSAHHNLFKIFLETCIDRNKRPWTSSQQLVSCFFWYRYPLLRNASTTGESLLPNCGTRHPTIDRKMSGNGIMYISQPLNYIWQFIDNFYSGYCFLYACMLLSSGFYSSTGLFDAYHFQVGTRYTLAETNFGMRVGIPY